MKQTYYSLLIIAILAVIAGYVASPISPIKPRLGLDVSGGVRIVLKADLEHLNQTELANWPSLRQQLASTILLRRAAGSLGVQEAQVHTKGDPATGDQFVIELPGYTDLDQAQQIIGSTARIEFYWFKQVDTSKDRTRRYTIEAGKDEYGKEIVWFVDKQDKNKVIKPTLTKDGPYEKLLANPDFAQLIVSGTDLKNTAKAEPGTKGTEIAIEFNTAQHDPFGDWTSDPAHTGEILGIVLDKRVISAPTNNINERTGGTATITGNYTPETASKFAELLNGGALPVDLKIIQSSKIEPTLGRQALNKIRFAGLIAAGLIMAGMLIYYLLPGLLACFALILYSLFAFASYKLMNVTFSLAGIAGFILSVGMAVDANILIFERMKEELRGGKTLNAAIEAGFKRAFSAIIDSNVCTLITCAVLFAYGTDVVKGFATTLGAGVLISLFTAVTCTRTFLYLLVGKGVASNPKLFGLGRQIAGKSHFDFVNKRNLWFAISLIIILPGLFFYLKGGLKKNIEFTGGTETTYALITPTTKTPEEIQAALRSKEINIDNVQLTDGGRQLILHDRKTFSDKDTQQYIRTLSDAIESTGVANLSSGATKIQPSVEAIGSVIRQEMITNAFTSVLMASVLILIYITIRFAFEGGWSGLRFGGAAVIATLHDVLVVIGTSAIFGYFLNWEISGLFITAVLTIIGFSVHDTIVIFDRIRENLRLRARGETFDMLVNRSILQSFARSILTSLTVVITVTILLAVGSATTELKHFHAALLVGLISGTYSSIFNAAQILVVFDKIRASKFAQQAVVDRPMVQSPRTAASPSAPRPAIPRRVDKSTVPDEGTELDKDGRPKAPKRRRRM